MSHPRLDRAINQMHPIMGRLRTRRGFFVAATFSIVLIFLYTTASGSVSPSQWVPNSLRFGKGGNGAASCTPEEYAQGKWVYRPYWTRPGPLTKTDPVNFKVDESLPHPNINMTGPESVLKYARFEGCASSREFHWHLAGDNEGQFDRFPGPLEWEWVPGGNCGKEDGLREWNVEDVLRELVEGGGWLLVGDSVTENQFYSISCLLYPHVIATPDYTLSQWWERDWPQNLYLNPESPLLKDDDTVLLTKHKAAGQGRRKITPPPGFNITSTPLVTFRRVDLFYSEAELKEMHRELHPEFYTEGKEFVLFGDEVNYTLSPDVYLDIFFKPLPEGNYKTLITSSAGHWTTNNFHGYHRESEGADVSTSTTGLADSKNPVMGYDGLLQFYGEVVERWANKIQDAFDVHMGKTKGAGYPPGREKEPQAIVRAYLPGHEDCHNIRQPATTIPNYTWNWWNWGEIWKFNRIWENLLKLNEKAGIKPFKNVHFLRIDRPGRLRPDAHATGDCLHIMAGAGVMEGWTHYIWHYVSREVQRLTA
ncbi:hypothetical protein DFP72DRAFT_60340 [Ephemerocybe angulata]|uniref:Uncharacterized protein n=1 Tax=Ephemerocybe angulata TaxID=980116 RepID=A0A8H6LV00_9AGAR|nr:hypothetical protein DFP72DRAFT_60340 [Tulosesus angulatus]